MILWIVISVAVLALAHFYIGRRLIRPMRLSRRATWLAWGGLIAWWIVIFLSLILTRSGGPLTTPFSWIAYVSLGLLSFLFFLLLIRDILLLLGRAATGIGSLVRRASGGARTQEFDRSRRTHLLQITNAGVVGLAASFTGYGIFEARRRPGIVEITVPIARLPKQFVGFRIVQITDVHAGLTVGREWIERVVEEVRGLKPDMIAFTGDVADGMVANLRSTVEPFASLTAPHGKFFITGNHEYYSNAEEWVAEMRRLGYDVLMNEHRLIERGGARIVLGGVTDYTGGNFLPSHRSDPEAAFRDAPTDLTRIFLAHQPKTLRQTETLAFDLMISGHTHGGQFFPWNLATTLDQPYLKGLHLHEGKWVYVSKGTGYWGPPVRVGARSEVTVITLSDGTA